MFQKGPPLFIKYTCKDLSGFEHRLERIIVALKRKIKNEEDQFIRFVNSLEVDEIIYALKKLYHIMHL